MFKVKVEVEISTAHRLLEYAGACNNLHGHNYHITVSLARREVGVPSTMVIDMKILRKFLRDAVKKWDHVTLLNVSDPLIEGLQEFGVPVCTTIGDPTAENMAKILHKELHPFVYPYNSFEVRVRETEKGEASYELSGML